MGGGGSVAPYGYLVDRKLDSEEGAADWQTSQLRHALPVRMPSRMKDVALLKSRAN